MCINSIDHIRATQKIMNAFPGLTEVATIENQLKMARVTFSVHLQGHPEECITLLSPEKKCVRHILPIFSTTYFL